MKFACHPAQQQVRWPCDPPHASGAHKPVLANRNGHYLITPHNSFAEKRDKVQRYRNRFAAAAAAGAARESRRTPEKEDSDTSGRYPPGRPRVRQPVDPRQLKTPLVDAVRQRGDAVHEAPFHVPGHKRGSGAPEGLARLVRPTHGSVLQYDLTEISGLDFLSSPSGVIQAAQQLAAEAFGADRTWFLVNGCSVGIHAAVMAVTAAAASASAAAAGSEAAASEAVEPGTVVVMPFPAATLTANGAAGTWSANGQNPRSSSSFSNCKCDNRTDVGRNGVHGSGSSSNSSSSGSSSSNSNGGDVRVHRDGSSRVTLVVARNCHLSAFSAMVLAGCEPYWVQPEVDSVFGVAHCVTHGSVREALQAAATQGRRVAGVLIVSPTYFGAVADVEAIAAVCHEYGVPLIVDEAHGGHFAFLPSPPSPPPPQSPEQQEQQHGQLYGQEQDRQEQRQQEQERHGQCGHLQSQPSWQLSPPLPPPPPTPPPPSALRSGADLVIQSTHKVLGAMTQAAMLHATGPRVETSRLSRALQTLQSSSPSYLLMASLDAARAQAAAAAATAGTAGAFDEPCAAAQAIRAAVSRCKRIQLLNERTAGSTASVRYFDPLRLTLMVEALQLPGGGFGAAEWLEARHGVVPELATAKNVVLALGPGTTMAHAAAAVAALRELDEWTPEGEGYTEAEGLAGPAVAAAAAAVTAVRSPLADRRDTRKDESEPSAEGAVKAEVDDAAARAGAAVRLEVEVVLTPRAAYFKATESVAASEAVGRISAELLCPYPPGVPVVLPGERITAAALEVLGSTLAAGGAVTGAGDATLATIQVVVMA